MSDIDYRKVRNAFRAILLDETTGCITADQLACEGRPYNSASQDIYVEEICGIDSEPNMYNNASTMIMTISYNVYGRMGANINIIEDIEDLRQSIIDLFKKRVPFVVDSTLKVWIYTAQRRTATNNEGWRLAPVDINFSIIK